MARANTVDDKLAAVKKTERTPEEETLLMRLRAFITMRWFAVFGVLAVALVARYGFEIGFDILPVYIICVFMAAYNLVLRQQAKALDRLDPALVIPRVRKYGYIHIMLDMLTLTVLLHYTGGIENPFLFFFAFHIVLASIGLHYRIVYVLATAGVVLVALVAGLEYLGWIPHVNLVGFADPARYTDVKYILTQIVALEFLLYGVTYVTTSVTGELRKRQRQVVELRERLLKEQTGELRRASSEIAHLEEEKSRFLQFIGIAAHDLKAPLAAIQGFLWVMLGGFAGKISDKQRDMLERSSQRITGLQSLISDLLDIPRIETGQLVQEMKEVSLQQTISDSVDAQRALAQEKGIKLKVEIPEGLSQINGSSSRLQQVMTNLVNNAINYTPEGTVNIRVTEQDKDVLVEIVDTGIGIPAADIPRLFEDFYRASNTASKGTGLGLSITKRIVEAHGGKIWVESPCPKTKKGSRFCFTLPKTSKTRRR